MYQIEVDVVLRPVVCEVEVIGLGRPLPGHRVDLLHRRGYLHFETLLPDIVLRAKYNLHQISKNIIHLLTRLAICLSLNPVCFASSRRAGVRVGN